jgi:creatinine amidohydrolase/Fe(II)-dependent formamide hydrolase-like protein
MKKSITLAMTLGALLTSAALFAAEGPAKQDPRSMGGGDCAKNAYNCKDAANPLPKANTVWLEEMTWMDVRDAQKAGKKTIIISTGGIEPNGPWLALGKHNYVLRSNCESIARALGNALCAPIVPFVPEGGMEPPTGHMTTNGTITLNQATFEALLTDIAKSLKVGGFENIIFIGDSGGNQKGQQAVATKLNAEWKGSAVAAHIGKYYDYEGIKEHFAKKGDIKGPEADEGMHDDVVITLNMYATDPESVRYKERVAANKATINGVSVADKDKNAKLAKEIIAYRTEIAVAEIKKAIANKGM